MKVVATKDSFRLESVITERSNKRLKLTAPGLGGIAFVRQ